MAPREPWGAKVEARAARGRGSAGEGGTEGEALAATLQIWAGPAVQTKREAPASSSVAAGDPLGLQDMDVDSDPQPKRQDKRAEQKSLDAARMPPPAKIRTKEAQT